MKIEKDLTLWVKSKANSFSTGGLPQNDWIPLGNHPRK
jgi:hypothetical protein